jgi:alpha-L-rhamnosidase
MLPDGSLNPGDMLSFNHYSLGSIADWLHRTVAGLAPAEPGYRRILVAPRPGGGLSRASAAHETPYGRAEVSWIRDGARLDVDVLVPVGTTATVRLPNPEWKEVEAGPGRHHFSCAFRPVEDDPARPPASQPLGLAPEGESGVFEA